MFTNLPVFLLAAYTFCTGFLIRDNKDYIAVFNTDGDHLFTTSIYSRDLPETDRRALYEGIEVADEIELWSRLEDFGS